MGKLTRKRKYDGYCNGFNRNTGNRCEKPITSSAIIGTGRCCLVKNKDFGCPNHGKGELVIKNKWIGVRNCDDCVSENGLPVTYGRERGINQIIWELE